MPHPSYPYRIPERFRSELPSYTVRELEERVNGGGYLSGFYYDLLAGVAAWPGLAHVRLEPLASDEG